LLLFFLLLENCLRNSLCFLGVFVPYAKGIPSEVATPYLPPKHQNTKIHQKKLQNTNNKIQTILAVSNNKIKERPARLNPVVPARMIRSG
jgi:hypothetical protein